MSCLDETFNLTPKLNDHYLFFPKVKNGLADAAKKDGIEETTQAMFTYLIDRVRSNLHVVLGMSPVGEAFR